MTDAERRRSAPAGRFFTGRRAVTGAGTTRLLDAPDIKRAVTRIGHEILERNKGADHLAVVGIAASGRTPYTVGALEHARGLGALTIAVTCVPGSEITGVAEIAIVPAVGPEVLAGSTRMKAGTAQKLVLNMLSTATMIRLGYVTGNRMTNMLPRNSKLRARSIRILVSETGTDAAAAETALDDAGGHLPTALVMLQTGCSPEDARRALDASQGVVAGAVASVRNQR